MKQFIRPIMVGVILLTLTSSVSAYIIDILYNFNLAPTQFTWV